MIGVTETPIQGVQCILAYYEVLSRGLGVRMCHRNQKTYDDCKVKVEGEGHIPLEPTSTACQKNSTDKFMHESLCYRLTG